MTIPVRYRLLAWTFSLSVLLYVDRVCMSTAKEPIARDLGFNDREMGWVMAVFALGYALFQTPGGWLADRLGPRISLTLIVVFWSFFTGLTALMSKFWSLLATRFLFGAGEAGAYPGVACVTYRWIPLNERGLIQGINFSGSRIGGAISLMLLPAMIESLGWKGSFVALMVVGFGWAAGWFWWFRNDPAEHPAVRADELQTIMANRPPLQPDRQSVKPASDEVHVTDPPATSVAASPLHLSKLFRSSNLWLVSLQYFSSNFTFFFCLTWLFPHLKSTYQLEGLQAGLYSAAPLVCGALGNWLSGWLVDRIYRSGAWVLSRRVPAIVGFALATIGLLSSVAADHPLVTILWFSLAIFGADMTISPSWSVCIDIGQRQAGLVSGTMNMAGNIGSFLTGLAFPYLAAWTGSDTLFFYFAAAFNLVAIPIWCLIDCRRKLGAT